MKPLIQLCYKVIWLLLFQVNTQIANYILRTKLWLNNVCFGTGITSGSVSTFLRISKEVQCVTIGNNIAFNSNDGPSWNCKCYIQVHKRGKLIIGDNSSFNEVLLFCTKSIIIGQNVKIGEEQ